MAPKSIVYMVVAVFVGYMLVSAVPGQMAMYTAPTLSGEKGDTITISGDGGEVVTLTGKGFSPENESASVEQGNSVELYYDRVTTNGTYDGWDNNESIFLDIAGAADSHGIWIKESNSSELDPNGGPEGSFIIVEGRGFSADNESLSDEIIDYSDRFDELSDDISSVAELAADAVEAAEAAADAVTSVASIAGETYDAAVDAAEAAKAAKDTRFDFEFMGTMVWLTVDVFIALVVYWFAKRRFT